MNGSNIHYQVHAIGEDKQTFEAVIEDLTGGDYKVSVFIIKENGLPFERVVTQPKGVFVSTINGKLPYLQDCINYKCICIQKLLCNYPLSIKST